VIASKVEHCSAITTLEIKNDVGIADEPFSLEDWYELSAVLAVFNFH